ncbi:MAG: response regulator [Caldilineaceae bacterium]|nr:response regulator [Caldilineaceae bacterium]
MITHRVLSLTDQRNAADSWVSALEQFEKTYSIKSIYRPTVLVHEAANFDLILIEAETNTIADALQTCRSLRSWTNKPILVLSSQDDEGFALEVYAAGADEYIIKPISITLLHAKLKAWQRWSMPKKRHLVVTMRHMANVNARPH